MGIVTDHVSTISRDLIIDNESILTQLDSCRSAGLVGASPPMRTLFSVMATLSASTSPLLICGPTGSGKTALVRALHQLSHRSHSPLRFYTAAHSSDTERDSICALQAMAGSLQGSICIEHVELMSPIQHESVQLLIGGLGGKNARIFVTTRLDPSMFAIALQFPHHVFAQLRSCIIELPSLHQRKEDIPMLAAHFCLLNNDRYRRRIHKISRETLQLFERHDWPGNIRELEHVIEHCYLTGVETDITPQTLPLYLQTLSHHDFPKNVRIESLQKELVDTLRWAGWNKAKAARKLHISRETLYRRMRRLNVSSPVDEQAILG